MDARSPRLKGSASSPLSICTCILTCKRRGMMKALMLQSARLRQPTCEKPVWRSESGPCDSTESCTSKR